MPIDNWFILALIMIFSSVIFCAVIPMIFRLITARRRHHHYRIELHEIACSTPEILSNLPYEQRQALYEHSVLFSQLPFIDDDTFV